MKWVDPIVQEVRAAREKIWKESNYDLDQLCATLREKQISHGLQIFTKTRLLSKRHITTDLQRYHSRGSKGERIPL